MGGLWFDRKHVYMCVRVRACACVLWSPPPPLTGPLRRCSHTTLQTVGAATRDHHTLTPPHQGRLTQPHVAVFRSWLRAGPVGPHHGQRQLRRGHPTRAPRTARPAATARDVRGEQVPERHGLWAWPRPHHRERSRQGRGRLLRPLHQRGVGRKGVHLLHLRGSWHGRFATPAVQFHPDGGSIRFRLALHTYDAPSCGPSVRVVPDRLTKSRKNTHPNNIPALFRGG